jgi:ERCC4-type nuclease
MIDLIVDNRETKVLASIQDRDLDKYKDFINIQVKPLDIGDVEISSSLVKYILERKTVADLISSLHDGRYKEQKYRLLSSGHHITYIIEGDDILSSRHQKKDILSSIYLYSIYRDNIHIVFTKNIEDTCTFVLTLCAKIVEKPEKFIKTNNDYIDNVKMKKCKNITPELCYIMQLSQIPTISTTIAKNIANKFPTLPKLLQALHESPDKVSSLTVIDKVGKEKANKIIEYFQIDI